MEQPTLNEISQWIGLLLIQNCFKHDVPYDDIKESAKRYADIDFVEKIEMSLQKKQKTHIYIKKLVGDLEKMLESNSHLKLVKDTEEEVKFLDGKLIRVGDQTMKVKQYKFLKAYYVLTHPTKDIRTPTTPTGNTTITEEIVEEFKNYWQDSILYEKAKIVLDNIKTIT